MISAEFEELFEKMSNLFIEIDTKENLEDDEKERLYSHMEVLAEIYKRDISRKRRVN